MGDSILDWVTGPGLGQLLGFGGANAATMPTPPQQPPPPPPNVMANAPASFAPNSSFDGGGLPFNQRFSPGPEPSAPTPSFADRAAPAEGAIRNGDFDPQGRNFTPYTPPQAMPFAAEPQPQPPPVSGSPAGPPQQADDLVINRTPRNGPASGPDMSPAAAMRRRDEGTQSIDEMELDRRGGGPPPTNILPGGLAASLGARPAPPSATPSPYNREISNALMGLGKGLSAVGQLKPGTTGAASFAAGAGGALEGSGQHEDRRLDRDIKQKEHEAALALRSATLDENQRYHKDRVDVEREKMTARLGGGPGGRDFQFDHKYNAWLAVHKDDHEGALDYANGHKKMDPGEQNKAALTLAQQMLRDKLRQEKDNPDGEQTVTKMTSEQRRRHLDELTADNRKRLRGESAYQPPAPTPPPPGSLPLGTRSALHDPDSGATTFMPSKPQATPPQAPGAPLSRPVVPGTPVPQPPGPAIAPVPPAGTPAVPPTTAPKRVAPPLPKGTPPGSGWSEKLQVWRSPDGKFFDKDGKPVAGPT